MKTYTVDYYLEATISFSAEVEANSEEEAKQIVEGNMGSEEHEQTDWVTNKYVCYAVTGEEE